MFKFQKKVLNFILDLSKIKIGEMINFYQLKKNRDILLLFLAGILSEACYLTFQFCQGDGKSISFYILTNFNAFVLFFAVWFLLKNIIRKEKTSDDNKRKAIILYIILSFAIVFRISLMQSHPSTSDDVYRYIWEGKVNANGYNPFELPPDSDELIALHSDKLPELVSFKHMTAIYPPAAQLIFTAGYLLGGENDFALKIIYLFFEALTLIFMLKILELKSIDKRWILLYAWLPLPVMEYFINSHIDAAGISFMIIFIYFSMKQNVLGAALFFGLSVMTKLYPALLILLMVKHFGFKKFLIFSAVSAVVILLLTLPFIPQNRGVIESLLKYLGRWSFNGSVFKILFGLTGDGHTVRLIIYPLFAAVMILTALKYSDLLKGIYTMWIFFIIFSPTLYPWYLGWIGALNPFGGLFSVNWLFFSSNLSNFTPLGAAWQEYWWVQLIEYIPFYGLLFFELVNFNKIKLHQKLVS